MSNFIGKQKEECKIEEVEVQEVVCPSCIPNPFAPTIDWLTQEEPYFDEKTCEYIIRAIGHKVQDVKINGVEITQQSQGEGILASETTVRTRRVFETLREYALFFKEKYTRDLLRHFDKEITKESLNISTLDETQIIVNTNSLVNFRISIQAEFFNSLPSASGLPEPEEDKEPAEELADLPNSIVINDNEHDLFSKMITTKLGILSYELNYSYYRQINKGVITYNIPNQVRFFEPKHVKDSLDEFKKELDKLLRLNGMEFYSLSNVFFSLYDIATEVEIVLDNSDPNKPMAIDKVFAQSGMCPRLELKKGIDSFKEKAYNPQGMYFLSNIEQAYDDITAEKPKEWLEFFEQYTYPPINASITDPEEVELEPSAAACALDVDIGKLAEGLLENFLIDAWDIFSFEFDKTSCSDDPIKREPALKQSLNPDVQKRREELYKEEMKRLRKERQEQLEAIYEDLVVDDETDFQDESTVVQSSTERMRERLEEFNKQLEEDAGIAAEKRLAKMEKESAIHPFYDHFANSMKKRLENDQSILSIFKKIQSEDGKASEKTQKFVSSIGLCGLTKGFKDALKCLTKQVDYKTMVTTAIKSFLKPLPFADLSEILGLLLAGLPPDKQVEVQIKIEEKFGKIKPPWESGNNADPDYEERKKEQAKTKAESTANPVTPQYEGESQTLKQTSQAIQNSLDTILEAYTEAILGVATLDELIEEFRDKCPALAFIIDMIDRNKCPTPPDLDIQDKNIKKYSFDVCDPTLPPINFKIPKFSLKPNLFAGFKDNIIKAIREAIMKTISLLVDKLIKILEEKLCDALSALGKAGLDFFSGNPVDFGQILKDSFCPDATDDEIADLGNKLLNNVGVGGGNAFDCFTGAILGTMSQREMIDLITSPEKDEATLKLFMETIKVGCPEMYDLVNSPSRASNFFDSIGNLIPEDTRNRLRQVPLLESEVPIYNTICLTSEELNAWNEIRSFRLQGLGLSDEEAAEQIDTYNQRARDALEEALDAVNNGPEADLNDLINDLLSPLADLPEGCLDKQLEDGESNFGNKVMREPKELVSIQDELSNRIFQNIIDVCNRRFYKDNDSLISKILTDTSGIDNNLHKFLEKFFFTSLAVHNTETEQTIKEEKANFLQKLFELPFDIGYYPQTVGIATKTQIEEETEYQSTVTVYPEETITFYDGNAEIETEIVRKKEYQQSSYVKQFSRTISGTNDSLLKNQMNGEVGFISRDLIDVKDNLDYKIRMNCGKLGVNISSLQETDSEQLVESTARDDSLELRNNVFNEFMKNRCSQLSYLPEFTTRSNYENTMKLVLNSCINSVIEKSKGFDFGYEEEDLQENDLLYVNPEADPNDESTWEYTYSEEEKVLGKSATENPRVFFLNPDEYGGSYEVPPIYIKPKEMQGWMGVSKRLFPDEEECDPKTEGIFSENSIKKMINKTRNSLSGFGNAEKINEKCFFYKPFDRMLSRNAISGIEGIIKISIRMKIVEEFIKSIPIASCMRINKDNFDLSNVELIAEKLIVDLKRVNPFGPREIEKENYYLVFLEQCFEIYERRVIKNLPKKIDPETTLETNEYDFSSLGNNVKEAYEKILSFRENFEYQSSRSKSGDVTLLKNTEVGVDILSNEDYGKLAGAFQKIGNSVFNSQNIYKYDKFIFESEASTNLFNVIFAIKLCEKECLEILKQMIFQEYQEMTEEFYKLQNPEIDNAKEYLLTNTDIFQDNKIINYGTHIYNQSLSINSPLTLGTAEDVTDVVNNDPFSDPTSVKFKIERYIRLMEKEDLSNITPEAQELITSRDYKLKGVVKIEDLQTFFSENLETLGEYYISDLFGNASVEDEESTTMSGKIGMDMGVRILLNLPANEIELDSVGMADLELSSLEKCFYCVHEDLTAFNSFSVPVEKAEIEIKEQQIKNLNLSREYDLGCLLNKIIEKENFINMFEKIIPIKAANSIALNYCNMFFVSSIGMEDGWEVDTMLKDGLAEKDNDAALVCRRYFASFYYSNKFANPESIGLPKIEFPDFFKMLFGGFEFPEINLNLILPLDFKFDHKIVRTNPFDKNGDECADK